MITEDVVSFLKDVIPFQFLKEEDLIAIAEKTLLEFYPKNTFILKQDGPPSDSLKIIKKGSVKVYARSESGEEIISDYRGEGELIGYLTLFTEGKSRVNVVTLEDTLCYLISKAEMLKIMDRHPNIKDFFHQSFLKKYLDKTFQEMHLRNVSTSNSDILLYTTPIGNLATKGVISAFQDISIREAAEIMTRHEISSLVLIDSNAVPVGIITDRDLRKKVVARGLGVDNPVSMIMSSVLIKSDVKEYCFEALLKMIRYNIHHLLVVEEGKLKGIVTNHDLMLLQGSSPLSLAKDIENQQSIEGLITVSKKINMIVGFLLKEGAKASNITKIITELNDRLVRKILEIAEKKYGKAPTEFCWIVFGSEGRKEQTFKTDQDNAIIYAEDSDEAKRYFADFTIFVRDSLIKCGFPLCPADYMASNPKWCQPLKIWKNYFHKWIATPTPEAVLMSLIFFDFRPLFGDFGLAKELRDYLTKILKGQNIFLAHMAGVITKIRPPLGFLRTFVVDKSGEHKDKLNLKNRGIGHLVDIVRLFSLESGITETSTIERIRLLKDVHPIVRNSGDELVYAFEFITLLRIHHQIEQIEKNEPPDNFINPSKISNLERKSLKESFQIISKMQDIIIDYYRPGIVGG